MKHQEDAVVMPGGDRTPGLERVGVQFGSLNLFGDGQVKEELPPPIRKEEPVKPLEQPLPTQREPEPQVEVVRPAQTQLPIQQQASHLPAVESRLPHSQITPTSSLPSHDTLHQPSISDKLLQQSQLSSQHPSLHSQQQHSQQQQSSSLQQQQQAAAALSVLSHPAQQVSNPSQQVSSNSPFGNRYQMFSTSGTSNGSFGLQNNQHGQPQQSQVEEQPSSLSSQYQNFANTATNKDVLGSNYFQSSSQQQPGSVSQSTASANTPASVSTAPSSYAQQQTHAPFGASGGVFGSTGLGAAGLNTSSAEYGSVYGQEALRNMGFYDGYTQQQLAQLSFQNRSPLPTSLHDDPSKGASSSSATGASSASQAPSAAQQPQGFPNAPIYYPYYQYQAFPSTYPTHGMSAPPSYAQPYGVTPGYYPMVPQQQMQQAAAQQAGGVGRNGYGGQGVGGAGGLGTAGVGGAGFRGQSGAGYPYGMASMGYGGYEAVGGGQAPGSAGLGGVGAGVASQQSLRGIGGGAAGMGGQGLGESRKDTYKTGDSHFSDSRSSSPTF
ncbi:hypothetical protein BT69DRAFT_302747 [Atractiella rhizophila]|nr:hypothetical protein BT69DRAFT_302747 [Atractiella rhizophila]